MPKVWLERIPNVGSIARESAKAMNLAFVLLDFYLSSYPNRYLCGRWARF